MKTIFYAILLIAMLVSLFLCPAQASAAVATWSAEPIPGVANKILGPAGIDIRDMSVADDGGTIYVTPGDSVSGNVTYKSMDAGASWETLSISGRADLVAVAPDDAGLIAVATSSAPAVYISINGGSAWDSLGIPQDSGGATAVAIYDIAISAASSGVHVIAVAGKEAGDVANVWYFKTDSGAPTWQETRHLAGFANASLVKAVAFSPDFASDGMMIAVSEKHGLSVDFQVLNFSSEEWNASAGLTGYPVTIVADDGITGLTSAAVSLSPSYLGTAEATRIAFVGLAVSGDAAARATGGIYRLNNADKKALKTGVNIHSVDFNGVNLVAGLYDNSNIYRSADPLAAVPAFSDARPLKRPGGENKTVVSRVGGNVVAGTSGNESAFAISGDNGETFNDVSLIDTVITNARDVAVSPDGGKVYLATDDGTDLSLWRRASSWERVLSIQGAHDYIVRISPENPDAVYLAGKGVQTIYYSGDGGRGEWLVRDCRVKIQDLAVESSEIVYALSSEGHVSTSTSAGFGWGEARSTALDSGNMIVSVSGNNLLVGSNNGYAAYSTDGNASWVRIPKILQTGAGRVQLVADGGFAANNIIYAASDKSGQNIKKWTIGSSNDWTDIFAGGLSGGVYGLAMAGGVLYALEYNSTNGQSTVRICTFPTLATASSSSWSLYRTSTITDSDDVHVHLNATPSALRVSSGGRLWAVKTNDTNKLYGFTAALHTLTLGTPANGISYPVNATTGVADDIVFSWQRPQTATSYELNIALDPDFDSVIATVTEDSSESTITVTLGPGQAGNARITFVPGVVYYWRVRVTQPFYSGYSDTRSFNIESIGTPGPALLAPANGSAGARQTPSFSWAPVSGITEYRFVLADNYALDSPIVDIKVTTSAFALSEGLDIGKTYYWAVKSLTPVESDWSIVANFTVEEKKTTVVPPVVVTQVPPPEIHLPSPPPPQPEIVISQPPQPEIVISQPPPPEPPAPVTPSYIWAAIIAGSALLVAVIMLVARTFRQAATEPAVAVSAKGEKSMETPEAQSVLLKAQSFRWMTTSGEGGISLLPADEERELGRTIASDIRSIAESHLLYSRFPEHAALLLYLWARYGSREETGRYLADSFQTGAKHVMEFLNCYRSDSWELEFGPSPEGGFGRPQYDSISGVVDPDDVFKALRKRYGSRIDASDNVRDDASPDKVLAYQFVHIHRQAMSETDASTESPKS